MSINHFDSSEHYEADPLESAQQAHWEEEAHYWHTVTAFVDLIEQQGYDKMMSDVGYTIDRREADKSTRTRYLDAVIPCPDLSFLSIRKTGA